MHVLNSLKSPYGVVCRLRKTSRAAAISCPFFLHLGRSAEITKKILDSVILKSVAVSQIAQDQNKYKNIYILIQNRFF
jgi:hypothetical protein